LAFNISRRMMDLQNLARDITIAYHIAFGQKVSITVGDLKQAVKFLQKQKGNEQIQEAMKRGVSSGVKSALKMLVGLVPGGGTVAELLDFINDISGKDPMHNLVKGLFNKFKATPDSESAGNPIMKLMDIDDEYANMLDDRLEQEFIDYELAELEGLDDSQKLPDMNETLEDYIINEFEGHAISRY
jgi:hypothetical protein